MSQVHSKTILVLANSIKKYPSRCVAGIEMIPVEGAYNFGNWIRPVDPSQNEGALPISRTEVNGQPVKPLQVVKMIFSGPSNDPNHAEDWNLQPNTQWEFVWQYDHAVLASLPDQQGDLWGTESAGRRCVPTGTAPNTLRLVKPKGTVLFEAYHEYNGAIQKDQFKKFVTIPCSGVRHQFSVTDPVFEARHGISPGNVKKGERFKLELPPDGLVIVASLTPPFNGYQYKIAATIIEP